MTNLRFRIAVALGAVLALAAPALAQDSGASWNAEGGGSASGNGSGSGSASVTGSGTGAGTGGLGVGAEATTTGLSGASVVYDAHKWRVGGFLGLRSGGGTDVRLGGRFFFRLHQRGPADFSIGAGVGIDRDDGDDRTDIHVEVALQLRAFIVPNVALGGTSGAGFVAVGNDGQDQLLIGGQLLGAVGLWYFF